uniref:Uncharacterized protein n=1 Tax=Tanacetum cinerariifolium TaxID=118510 RepID=A0A699IDL8_TANCI|nr:hypothetical protein [Tanacetum cinerariifolium]GEZ49057.1 hypothetical protein [Tanacetum cinerariifolium]
MRGFKIANVAMGGKRWNKLRGCKGLVSCSSREDDDDDVDVVTKVVILVLLRGVDVDGAVVVLGRDGDEVADIVVDR